MFARAWRFLSRRLSPKYRELGRLRNAPRYLPTRTLLLGFPLQVPDGPSFHSAYCSIFEHETLAFQTSRASPRILDAGANIGLASLYLLRAYPEARLTALEPDPRLFEILRQNLAAGHPGKAVELVQAALAGVRGKARFFVEGADAGHLSRRSPDEQGRTIEVECVPLSDFLREPVDLLKMDIEGAELEVLRGAGPGLSRVERIFVEYHSFLGREQELDELLSLLRHAGFRCHVHSPLPAARPFLSRPVQAGMDLQLDIYGFREPVAEVLASVSPPGEAAGRGLT